MSKQDETFFTRVGCMDGRVQTPIRIFGNNKFNAEYPDTITEAGKVGLLVNSPSKGFLNNLKKKLNVSIKIHHSKGIVLHGHQECAGHPVSDIQHKKDVLKAIAVIKSMVPKNIPVVPVFVKRRYGKWVVEEL